MQPMFRMDPFISMFCVATGLAGIIGAIALGLGVWWFFTQGAPFSLLLGSSLIGTAGVGATLLSIHDNIEIIKNQALDKG